MCEEKEWKLYMLPTGQVIECSEPPTYEWTDEGLKVHAKMRVKNPRGIGVITGITPWEK